MTADQKPYPAMKHSGIDWLGDVPEHWEVRRLRTIAELRVSNVDKHTREDETRVRLCNYVDVYKNDRISEEMDFMQATATPDEIERFRLDVDDVLITKDSETWDDIGVPALVKYSADDLISGYHLALLRPFKQQISGGYLLRALQSKPVAYQFHVEATGVTRYGLSQDGIKSIWFPLPPQPEQVAIVRFLDHMDRRINRLIRAKRRHIELLNEQKQAIINQAVTRGLDPNVRLKPSGIEWLGEVPEHWDARPAKYSLREVNVRSETGEEELLSVSHITGVTPRSQKNITMFRASSYVGHKVCQPGDLVVNTMWAWMGALGVSDQVGIVSPSYAVYRPLRPDRLLPEFLDQLLRTKPYISEFICCSAGIRSSRLRLYPEKFLQIPLILPPIEEQIKLVSGIMDQLHQIDAAIEITKHEIDLLREYRTRVIADVVTGKLDVRGVELPELDDDEPVYLDVEEETELDDLDDSLEAPDDDE